MRAESLIAAVNHDVPVDVAPHVSVCIIGDPGILRAGVRLLLEDAGMVVIVEAANLSQALQSIGTVIPDIFVVDLETTAGNGLEVLAELVLLFGSPRILG